MVVKLEEISDLATQYKMVCNIVKLRFYTQTVLRCMDSDFVHKNHCINIFYERKHFKALKTVVQHRNYAFHLQFLLHTVSCTSVLLVLLRRVLEYLHCTVSWRNVRCQ